MREMGLKFETTTFERRNAFSTLAVSQIADALDANCQPIGALGEALQQAFPRFADDLAWWTEAAKAQRARKLPPY